MFAEYKMEITHQYTHFNYIINCILIKKTYFLVKKRDGLRVFSNFFFMHTFQIRLTAMFAGYKMKHILQYTHFKYIYIYFLTKKHFSGKKSVRIRII